uniref:ERCC4 domain-containing protein n=1 Tax=Strongyloides papillosus TaxID=174720 RepID=A0A0N5BBI3_STREA
MDNSSSISNSLKILLIDTPLFGELKFNSIDKKLAKETIYRKISTWPLENKANLFLDLMWKGTPEEIMPKVEYMAECLNFGDYKSGLLLAKKIKILKKNNLFEMKKNVSNIDSTTTKTEDLMSQISNNSSSLPSSIPMSEPVLAKKVNVSSLILSNDTSNTCSLDPKLQSASLKNNSTSSLISLISSNDSTAKIIASENLKIALFKPANKIEKEKFLNNSKNYIPVVISECCSQDAKGYIYTYINGSKVCVRRKKTDNRFSESKTYYNMIKRLFTELSNLKLTKVIITTRESKFLPYFQSISTNSRELVKNSVEGIYDNILTMVKNFDNLFIMNTELISKKKWTKSELINYYCLKNYEKELNRCKTKEDEEDIDISMFTDIPKSPNKF